MLIVETRWIEAIGSPRREAKTEDHDDFVVFFSSCLSCFGPAFCDSLSWIHA